MAWAFLTDWSFLAVAAIILAVAYAFLRKALLTLALGVAILFVFALEVASQRLVIDDLGLYTVGGTWSAPWTWVTFQFVHASWDHILLNLVAMLFIAPAFEERVGSLRFAVLFFVGGAVGAAGFLLLNLAQNPFLVGASAGISAVFGAYGRLFPREKVQLFLPIPGVPTLPVIEVVIGFLVLETALSLFSAWVGLGSVAWQAHVIAIVFGFAGAPLVLRVPSRAGKSSRLPSVGGLPALATTPELTRILTEAEASDLPEVRQAWIEKFVATARCPRCGGALRLRHGRLSSPCGWRGRCGSACRLGRLKG